MEKSNKFFWMLLMMVILVFTTNCGGNDSSNDEPSPEEIISPISSLSVLEGKKFVCSNSEKFDGVSESATKQISFWGNNQGYFEYTVNNEYESGIEGDAIFSLNGDKFTIDISNLSVVDNNGSYGNFAGYTDVDKPGSGKRYYREIYTIVSFNGKSMILKTESGTIESYTLSENTIVEPDPKDDQTSFMGLAEIYNEEENRSYFCNPKCDSEGRLIYYENKYRSSKDPIATTSYEYFNNKIETTYKIGSIIRKSTYYLTKGLITSFVLDLDDFVEIGEIEYNNNKQINNAKIDVALHNLSEIYNFTWDSTGDLSESTNNSYCFEYEYGSTLTAIPCMKAVGSDVYPYYYSFADPFLLMQGFYGNSIPKHNLKKIDRTGKGTSTAYQVQFKYTLDNNNLVTKQIETSGDDKAIITCFSWK